MEEPDAENMPPSLKTAVRKARMDLAERSEVVNELRHAELARLDILHDAFKPILAQVPPNVDMFDCGVTPGERPRLFIDMIAYVEMAHDRRTYRFVQETRRGRVTLCESDRLDPVVEALTDYVARRLVERETALAADVAGLYARKEAAKPVSPEPAAAPPPAPVKPGLRRYATSALLFTIELLGAIVLFILLMAAAYLAWRFAQSWWMSAYAQVR